MSAPINNGGPAFPVFPETGAAHEAAFRGMSLRDYFAAKAMHSELVTAGVPGDACNALVHEAERNGREVEAQIAWNAYRLADAMLRAREVQS